MTAPTDVGGGDRMSSAPIAARPHRRSGRSAAIGALMAAELRRLGRDRLALFFIVVMPVLVIVIVGATIGGGARHVPLAVIDQDKSAPSGEVIERLRAAGTVEVTTYDTLADLERDIRTSSQLAGLVIPPGFGAAATAGDPASVQVLAVQTQGSQTAQPLVQSAVDAVGSNLAATSFVTRVDNIDPSAAAAAVQQSANDLATVTVQSRTVGTPRLESNNEFSYTAPSNLVLFVFITSLAGGGALVETRRVGIARRMLAAPIGTGSIIAGFGAVRLLIALIQAVLIIAIGALVFGVAWGQTAGVAALVLIYACVATGAALTVGAVARNAEQATAIGIPIGIALGMLGGCMWPLDIVPPSLRAIGHLTPQAWAMDGFTGLVFNGKGLLDITADLAVLTGFAITLLALGIILLRRTLTRSA
jgi:ABC-2 type transport system permease protein